MAQRLLASTKEMPGALHAGQGEAQAQARKSVACMVLVFVIGKWKNHMVQSLSVQ